MEATNQHLKVGMKHPDPAQRDHKPPVNTLDGEVHHLIIKQANAIKEAFFEGAQDPLAMALLYVLKDFDARPAEMAAKTFLEERGFVFLAE